MDYTRESVLHLLRGPLVHTPQGLACVAFGFLAVLVGAISFFVPPHVAAWPLFRAGPALFVWPFGLFCGFCYLSYRDNFKSSYVSAVLISIAGLVPLIGPYVRDLVV
jgi:hypothetical protein